MLTANPHSVLGLFEKQTNGYSRNSSHHRSKHLVTMRRLALEALEGGEGGALYPFFSIFWVAGIRALLKPRLRTIARCTSLVFRLFLLQ